MGLFQRDPCFVSSSSIYVANPNSPTYHTDQMTSITTSIALADGQRGEIGKQLTEKLRSFKENDPAGYASFNESLKEKGMQGGLAGLIRDHSSVVLNNFDRIKDSVKPGQPGLAARLGDLQGQTAGLTTERQKYYAESSRQSASQHITQQRVAETPEPYRSPAYRGMYNTPQPQQNQGYSDPQQATRRPMPPPGAMDARMINGVESGQGFGRSMPGAGMPAMGGSMSGGMMSGGSFNFSNLGQLLNSIMNSFMGGRGSGQDFGNATDGFQRYSSRAALDRAPDARMPFNVGGQNFGNVLQGLDLGGLRQGNMSMGGGRPAGADLVMGGGIGGGMSEGPRSTSDVIGRAMNSAFKL